VVDIRCMVARRPCAVLPFRSNVRQGQARVPSSPFGGVGGNSVGAALPGRSGAGSPGSGSLPGAGRGSGRSSGSSGGTGRDWRLSTTIDPKVGFEP
jgi:hypothetical protein